MKIFSIPLNPKLSEKQFGEFLQFCKNYKDYIYDVYFTCRIAPFLQDAMGDIFIQTDDNLFAIEVALYVQNETGIPVSATFNNIQVRPDQKNLDIWIRNFKPLYDRGVRSCTLPHTHWMLTGQIKNEFPELFVKNTILRDVKEPRDVAGLAMAGFDYINLDRDLMRDKVRLQEIIHVKDKYKIKLSLLANEGCLGGCPVMDEHYQFNNTRINAQYFNDPISRVSCSKWDTEDSAIMLKTANFPPWRQDWVDFIDLGIDTIKMHGRESITRLYETLDIIKRFANEDEILFGTFNEYLKDTDLIEKPINTWREKIKTCKFDCWDCNYCDKVWRAKGNTNNKKVAAVAQILVDAVNHRVTSTVSGLSSNRTKQLLNLIGKISTSYLELGVLNGATFCAAIEGNSLVSYAVDHWQDSTQSATDKPTILSSKQTFISNAKQSKGANKIKVFDSHFLQVDKSKIGDIDFMFYDADHDPTVTANAVMYFAEKLTNAAVLIFDDANFDGVVTGARDGIARAGLNILYDKIILNDIEDTEQWWNGLYIVVIGK